MHFRSGVGDNLQQLQGFARILFCVQRQRRKVLCDFVPIAIVGFLFLQTRCIGQKNLEQISAAARTINWSAKTVLDEPRQIAGVIDVRVRDDHGIHRRRIERRFLPVTLTQFAQALKQSAIDQDLRAIRLNQILRAGHRAGRTPE